MRLALPLLVLAGCSDYDLTGKDEAGGHSIDDDTGTSETDADDACAPADYPPEACGGNDECVWEVGGFTPIVEWDTPGENSLALPVVADLDGDGMPEIIVDFSYVWTQGTLAVYHGDGSGEVWRDTRASLAMSSHPAVADLDGDGTPEIVAVKEYAGSLFSTGDFTVAAWSADGDEIWESEHYTDGEFDHATGPIISDMDHDGEPEIVAGRVILHADGTERGVGRYGRGCPADGGIAIAREGSQPAVADIDLDGTEEVITGNAIYDPDGNALWNVDGALDGAVSVANLDDDPEGEFVAVNWNEITAYDTDGSVIWGPLTNRSANIFPIPAIGDLDNDGYPDIVVAGGNELWVLTHDGRMLWTAPVHDESGATGASLFDFDGDGVLEVVYIDEQQMIAFNGSDGVVKFQTDEHSSATMYDYPVIADVDADGHAEIVVAHDGFGTGFSVYGDLTDSWAPARKLWNQHAYTVTNINDDLTVPVTQVQNFTTFNSYHSALPLAPGESLGDELEGEIVDVCEDDCDHGWLRVVGRGLNTGTGELDAGIQLALYSVTADGNLLLDTATTTTPTPALQTTEAVRFDVDTALLADSEGLLVSVDDDGTGIGAITECVETNNTFVWEGTYCH
jgi:hypothetical protein